MFDSVDQGMTHDRVLEARFEPLALIQAAREPRVCRATLKADPAGTLSGIQGEARRHVDRHEPIVSARAQDARWYQIEGGRGQDQAALATQDLQLGPPAPREAIRPSQVA